MIGDCKAPHPKSLEWGKHHVREPVMERYPMHVWWLGDTKASPGFLFHY